MKTSDVQALLRQVLQASLAAPLAFAACGGQSANDVGAGNPGLDAATEDAQGDRRSAADVRVDDGAPSSDSTDVSDTANPSDSAAAGDVANTADAADTGVGDAGGDAEDALPSDAGAADASDDAIADVYVPNGCSTSGTAPARCDAAGICGGVCPTFSFPLLGDPAACGLVGRSGPPLCGSSNSAALCAPSATPARRAFWIRRRTVTR